MTVNADVVIDVFNSVIECLSTLLETSVGGWIGGFIILIFVLSCFLELRKI